MSAPRDDDGSRACERPPLLDSEGRELLRIMRVSLKEWLRTGRLPPGSPHRRSLLDPAPLYVVAHVEGEVGLARADGQLAGTRALYLCAAELTVAVARRKPALSLDDVSRLRLELAVLSTPVPLANQPASLRIGEHGILLKHGESLYFTLPSHARPGWTAEHFLAEACAAAGLPPHAWRDAATEVAIFTAQSFSD